MPWETPSLRDTRRLSRDYVASYLPGSDASVGNSIARVLADNNGGLAHLNLRYLDWQALQLLPDTAETEFLDRHGQIWLGGRKAATFAAGHVTVTGINGTILPIASRMQGGNGVPYETLAQITVGSGPTDVSVRALTPGIIGNLDAGANLGLTTVIAGVDGTATVLGISGGVDREDDDSLRDRVLFRIRRPPMGGSNDDYVRWARSVPGVTRAWNAPLEMGIGTTTVRFMMDELRADPDPDIDGFPLPADIASVQAYLDTVRPVAVKDIFVAAPIPFDIDFTITMLEDDSTATQAAINASVKQMLKERAVPGQQIWKSWITEAVSSAIGEDHHENDFVTTVMPSNGHLAVIGTILFA
jgi:uncharacterized phage protein gp47/JayE